MPFQSVDGKNYSEVMQGLEHYFHLLENVVELQPDFNGWDFAHYRRAAITMFGEAFDKGFEQLDTLVNANLDTRLKGLELIMGRLDEQVQAITGPKTT